MPPTPNRSDGASKILRALLNSNDWSERAAGAALSVSTTLISYGVNGRVRPKLRLALLAYLVRQVLGL